jgi:hypothetical protein
VVVTLRPLVLNSVESALALASFPLVATPPAARALPLRKFRRETFLLMKEISTHYQIFYRDVNSREQLVPRANHRNLWKFIITVYFVYSLAISLLELELWLLFSEWCKGEQERLKKRRWDRRWCFLQKCGILTTYYVVGTVARNLPRPFSNDHALLVGREVLLETGHQKCCLVFSG